MFLCLLTCRVHAQARAENTRTTIFQKDPSVTYQLKMKTSRGVLSEMMSKAGSFPINIRGLEEGEQRARLGLKQPIAQGLVKPYDVV